MNLFRKTLCLISIGILTSCAPKLVGKLQTNQYEPLSEKYTVYVLESNDEVPMNSEFIKDIKIDDSRFSDECSFKRIMNTAKVMTRGAGANILRVTQVKNPYGGPCFQLQGKIYRNLDSTSLKTIQARFELRNKSTLPENADYAIIHFYRPKGGPGFLLGYNIKTGNDSIIGQMVSGGRFDFKTKDFGLHSFYGVLETKASVSINIKKGEEYYVQCKVKYGIVLGRPVINLVENALGRMQYEKLK